jgi:hypothetical protein
VAVKLSTTIPRKVWTTFTASGVKTLKGILQIRCYDRVTNHALYISNRSLLVCN